MEGVITAYNKERGFGLISQFMVEQSIYFDIVDCQVKGLYIGNSVIFDLEITKRGRVAKNITAKTKPKISNQKSLVQPALQDQ